MSPPPARCARQSPAFPNWRCFAVPYYLFCRPPILQLTLKLPFAFRPLLSVSYNVILGTASTVAAAALPPCRQHFAGLPPRQSQEFQVPRSLANRIPPPLLPSSYSIHRLTADPVVTNCRRSWLSCHPTPPSVAAPSVFARLRPFYSLFPAGLGPFAVLPLS